MEELKPCPFCNSTSTVLVTDEGKNFTVYYVNCKGPGRLNGYCNCEGPRNFESIQIAIEAWNSRSANED